MVAEQHTMFGGLDITRKRKMAAAMESDTPYGVTTPPPETELSSLGVVELPWWADLIDSDELSEVIRSQCDEKVLLVDCRSFIEFNHSNIVNSINVCCNKIVKRRLQQDKLKIQDFLSSTCHIEIDGAYTIVLYDNATTDASILPEDSILTILGNKCSKAFLRVRVLYGGFLEFEAHHPSLLETKTKTPHQQATASLSQPCLPVTNIGPTKILPYLFLGSMKDALNADLAKANGITYVLNVSMTCPKPTHIQDGHFLRIPVNDNYSEKLLPYFHEAFQFIDKVREAGGCVLVHCLAGVSRSPTLAIAYIMRCYHMVSEEAYRYVKEKRVTISPNFNFLGQLLEYEQQMDKEDSSNFNGSKRRCIDDLRAELATPGSPIATPKIPKSASVDGGSGFKLTKAQSPTTALSKLKFEHNLMVAPQSSHSPTTAFAKLRFGAISEMVTPSSNPTSAEEPEFMHCYSSDTIHQNTSATSSPCDVTPSRTVNLHALNTNCNNANMMGSRSPSPNSMRPSRPVSLNLTKVDEISSPPATCRPVSLGVHVLQDATVEDRPVTKMNELTSAVTEATPPVETASVAVGSATVSRLDTFKLPEQVNVDQCSHTSRPRSVTVSEGSRQSQTNLCSPVKETSQTTLERLLPGDSPGRSRSLENLLQVVDSMPSTANTSGMSSKGSHSSLHGSMEAIKVL